MHDQRFARRLNDFSWASPDTVGQTGAHAKYIRDWRRMKRARFNAAKRLERKHAASTLAFAVAGIVGILVPFYSLLFKDILLAHTKNVLEFTAYVTGGLSLMIGLIEQAKNYPAKARAFHDCGRKINQALRRLQMGQFPSDAELLPLVEQYEKALEDCPDNHDEIDYQIARADEILKQRLGTAAESDARRTLGRLKWLELVHMYWLYGTTWIAPFVIGALVYFLGAPSD